MIKANSVTTEKEKLAYGLASDLDHLPPLTLTQEWLDEAEDEIRPVSMRAFCGSSWARLFDEYHRQRIVYVRDINVVLLRFEYPYELDLDRINSETDLLRWTSHSCVKT